MYMKICGPPLLEAGSVVYVNVKVDNVNISEDEIPEARFLLLYTLCTESDDFIMRSKTLICV